MALCKTPRRWSIPAAIALPDDAPADRSTFCALPRQAAPAARHAAALVTLSAHTATIGRVRCLWRGEIQSTSRSVPVGLADPGSYRPRHSGGYRAGTRYRGGDDPRTVDADTVPLQPETNSLDGGRSRRWTARGHEVDAASLGARAASLRPFASSTRPAGGDALGLYDGLLDRSAGRLSRSISRPGRRRRQRDAVGDLELLRRTLGNNPRPAWR